MTDKINTNNIPDLEDLKLLEKYKEYIDYVEFNNEIALAKDISDMLLALFGHTPNFNVKNPDLFKEYQSILIRARWVALPLLKDPDVLEMFEKYYMEGMAMSELVDIQEKLKINLLNHLLPEDRDKLKLAIRKALERNVQLITKDKLQADEEKRDPTIANWILDFTSELGTNMFDRVKENQYFVNGNNTKKLSETEKTNLRVLLNIYRRCGRSSLTLEGNEEPIPVDTENRVGTIREGQFEEIKMKDWIALVEKMKSIRNMNYNVDDAPAEMTETEKELQREKLIMEFLGSEGERIMIHNEENSLEETSNTGLQALVSILMDAVDRKDKYKAIAALRVIADKGNLTEEFKLNERVSALAKEILQKQYKPEITADFQRNGFTAPYLSIFLQHIFREKMNLDDAESARFGVQLENILVEKGQTSVQGMVYGDLMSGKYMWQAIKDEGVKLSIPDQI
ncbi:MAG: hypothetical protein WCW66_03055 [Patescibacteria group bacterium]